MNTLLLKLLFTIQGVGAASGLIYNDGQLYVISDNSNYLYHYSIDQQTLNQTLLIDRSINVDVPKKKKADLEAMTVSDSTLYIIGSGSSAKRNTLLNYHLGTDKTTTINIRRVYQSLRKTYSIAKEDFNIEGALFVNDELWLFNRGNGPSQQNGIFILSRDTFSPKAFHKVALPSLDNVPLGFTDAIWVDGKVYFTAAAEGGGSSYHDGGIRGTVLGCLNPETMQTEYTEIISKTQKFEGITVFKKTASRVEFLLCEDPDNGSNTSAIYRLSYDLPD